MQVRVQKGSFTPADELRLFSAQGGGAIASFTGIVRDDSGALCALEIEHYPAMTQKALEQFLEAAKIRFELKNSLIVHRYGRLCVGEPIMMVAAAATHRKQALGAVDFLMDYLKSRAPFWKKELFKNTSKWVQARDTDEVALKQWQNSEVHIRAAERS